MRGVDEGAEPLDREALWTRALQGLSTPPETSSEVRALLRGLGMRPSKGLGQNFLLDRRALNRIVDAAGLSRDDEVLEVGPGLGALTRELAARVGRLVTVEVDRRLIEALRRWLAGAEHVELVAQDVLTFDPCSRFRPRAYKVVANLPYYITSPTIRHFLENRCPPSLLVIMVQREVAERMVARPNDMSLLAVGVQFYADPRIVTLVPAQSFYPPPKVDSAVVSIVVPERPKFDVPADAFFTVAQAGFAQPRKQLHNSLTARLGLPSGKATALLRAAGIEPSRRPQTLGLEEWVRLTERFLADPEAAARVAPPLAASRRGSHPPTDGSEKAAEA